MILAFKNSIFSASSSFRSHSAKTLVERGCRSLLLASYEKQPLYYSTRHKQMKDKLKQACNNGIYRSDSKDGDTFETVLLLFFDVHKGE